VIATLINLHCEIGENPFWNPDDARLYWTDITGGKLYRYDFALARHEMIYAQGPVGGFTLQANGDLLLFRTADIAVLDRKGSVRVVAKFQDGRMDRFNDVIADPEGRVFAGTIGPANDSAALYRMDRDGTMRLLFRGTACSNGMGFSPDLKTFYWTCSTSRRIDAFDYDRATGDLSNRRVFYQATGDEGIPDGMTVDREGHIWSAHWDGYALVHHAPDSTVLERIKFPVAKVASVVFGGPDYDQMFITTAGGTAGSGTLDGALFQIGGKARGVPEFRSRIGL